MRYRPGPPTFPLGIRCFYTPLLTEKPRLDSWSGSQRILADPRHDLRLRGVVDHGLDAYPPVSDPEHHSLARSSAA